ncbi:bifunctional GNAT family N-acetyltransferase/acetate--CoA ligase family protein [Fodinicola acaciae]|uniref:bifunctional acetate--CoA ligase family protein/GNAT family N-acetyltransferase n=1 Tax=Fodinicola acaciae TaxID=2681555 RepID=UPI0013D61E97|nr:bifunctional GNAT family N-acetyltransferase/acetate--CoA ligase family protein [Fodinicola acaciae]
MAGYPDHRAADVLLSDGGTVHIRPIRESDADQVVALHSRFSDRTRYLRYFSPYPRIPERDLKRFVTVDHVDREAFVVELGDDLIAIGRYDRISADDAEVAFVVEDTHQGRGIGSVLLEHLAAAAQENHIRRFVAEVLPTNYTMMRVFSDAGYTVARSYDDGVVHLEWDVGETSKSIDVSRQREQRSEAASITRLLAPRSVAVIGASSTEAVAGRVLLENLREAGFAGPVYAVNPRRSQVAGQASFAAVTDIPGGVDLAVVAVPAAAVPEVVRQCGRAGVRGLVIVSGGFAEIGPEGRKAEREIVLSARSNGMRVVGPNCLGVLNTHPDVRLNASLAPTLPLRGRVGFFCQSGALGIALLDQAEQRGIGLSTVVSAGNRADVSGNDLMQYWLDDPSTDVVLLYLESFGNPRKFARVARRLARRKPVVAVKSSTPPPALAGLGPSVSDGGIEALFAQSGVIRVNTVSQLFDVAQILAYQPLPAGRTVAIVGNSAALGVLAADACAAESLRVADGSPVDIGPEASAEDFAAALRTAVADENVHALVAVFVPALATSAEAYANVLKETVGDCGKPVVSTFLAAEGVPERLRYRGRGGHTDRGSVPSYASPEEAVHALGLVANYADWRRAPAGTLPGRSGVDVAGARVVVHKWDARHHLSEHPDGIQMSDQAAADLLGAYGISVQPSVRCGSLEEALAAADSLGYPVALKASNDELRHRIDLGMVRLDIGGPGELSAAYPRIRDVLAASGADPAVLLQGMVDPGVACLVEVVDDPSFGLVLGFGLAGVATELLGDLAWRAIPVTDVDAANLVRAPLAAPLLFGHRGATPVDADALSDLMLRIGMLADDTPEIRHLTLRPVLARPDGFSVLHASVRLGPPAARPDHGPRKLWS